MSAYQTLENIKGKLIEIRDSDALQNVEADSEVAQGLAGVFGGVSDVLEQNSKGIASSNAAQTAVTNGEQVVDTSSGGNSTLDALRKLKDQNAKLTQAFENEKSTREGLEQNQSIQGQQQNQELLDIIANLQSGGSGSGSAGNTATTTNADGSVSTTDGTATSTGPAEGDASMVGDTEVDTGGDAIAQAMADSATQREALMQGKLDELAAFMEDVDDDHQATLRSIQNTAKLQAKRVAKENERLAQAAQVAGIVSGRGMYSPYEHEGIISDVIQDGLDRITEIENTAQSLTIEAKKAHREFRYEAFVTASDALIALEEMKMNTIVDIGNRLQQVEENEREKMRFDQEQADRTAFILAPELVGATPEQIRAAALANNIDPGALMRTVGEYQAEQEAAALDTRVAEESILSSQASRQVAQARLLMDQEAHNAAMNDSEGGGDGEDPEDPLTVDEIKDFADIYGLEDGGVNLIPSDWTRTDLSNFRNMYPDAPPSEVPKLIKKYNGIVDYVTNNPDVTDEELSEALSLGETEEEKVAAVENIMREGDWKFWGKGTPASQIADDTGDASVWDGDEQDGENWLKKKSTQDRIKELAAQGYEAYQIAQKLKEEFGVE